jgi:hypothetical protein
LNRIFEITPEAKYHSYLILGIAPA